MTVRCPQCGTRRSTRALLLAHMTKHSHTPCRCGGYHFPHRRYSPLCVFNSQSVVLDLLRQGCEDEETLLSAAAESAFMSAGRPVLPRSPIPF